MIVESNRSISLLFYLPLVVFKEDRYVAFSHHKQGSIDFNTANTTWPAGVYFLIHPLVWINDERMAVHCLELGCIGLYIPPLGSVRIHSFLSLNEVLQNIQDTSILN